MGFELFEVNVRTWEIAREELFFDDLVEVVDLLELDIGFTESLQFCVSRGELFRGIGEVAFNGGGFFGNERGGGVSADRLDPANPGSDGALTFDFEKSDLTGRGDVSPAAEFHRVTVEGSALAADLDDADFVPVFVAEELHHVGVVLHFGVGEPRGQ